MKYDNLEKNTDFSLISLTSVKLIIETKATSLYIDYFNQSLKALDDKTQNQSQWRRSIPPF